MVRLKHYQDKEAGTIAAEFQFHCGSIKTANEDKIILYTAEFQFHCGSIKT